MLSITLRLTDVHDTLRVGCLVVYVTGNELHNGLKNDDIPTGVDTKLLHGSSNSRLEGVL